MLLLNWKLDGSLRPPLQPHSSFLQGRSGRALHECLRGSHHAPEADYPHETRTGGTTPPGERRYLYATPRCMQHRYL